MRDRLIVILAHLTGASGPLRRAFDWLRAHGVGERVIKSALAGMLSYWLARFLPGNDNPILAPLTAIFSINLTIAGGMRDAWQRGVGAVLGIGVALLASWLIGPGSIAIGIVTLIAFTFGRRLLLEPAGVQQIAVTALLVLLGAAGTQVDNVAALHIANTLIGTGIGLLLNASVAPPNYVERAQAEILEIGNALQTLLSCLTTDLEQGITHEKALSQLQTARALAASLHEADAALAQAAESLQYNLLGANQRAVLERLRRADQALEHVAIQTRIIARSLTDLTATERPVWLDPDALGIPLGELVNVARIALDRFLAAAVTGHPPAAGDIRGDLDQRRDDLYQAALHQFERLLPSGWTLLGETVAVTSQLVADLEDAALLLGDPSLPERRA